MCACPGVTAVSLLALTTNQESRLTSVDLNLKHGVFCGWSKIPSDVYSCLFRALSTYEKTIGSPVLLELKMKEPQNDIYCLNFFKNYKIWNLRVLIRYLVCCLVCRHIVSFLFALWCMFHCVRRTWCVVWEQHCLSDIATVTKGGRVFANGQLLLMKMYNSFTFILNAFSWTLEFFIHLSRT